MNVLTDVLLIAAGAGFFYYLTRSFRNNPYAYRNIAITSVIILLIAIIIGRSLLIHVSYGETDSYMRDVAAFLWQFSRVLFIPISFLCLFLCISNAALLKNEGFRRSNFFGLIISLSYLSIINLLWWPLNTMPEIISGFLIFIRLLLCYAECTILSICIMGYAVLKLTPLYDRDFAIILGCSISKKGKVRPLLKGRVNRAIHFAWEQEIRTGKPVRYVPSGGQGPDEPMSEGSAMELYLLSHSAEENEVFPEKKSRNTKENLIFSKEIIDGLMRAAKVTVVTTNFHVLRSGMLAHRAGLMDVTVIGSGTKWYFWPNAFFRETVAIVMMFFKVHIAVAIMSACAVFLLS